MRKPITRRTLLGRTAGAGALCILANASLVRGAAANERINVAIVGVGGRGEWFIDTIPRMENVVAICDVNQQKLNSAFEYWEGY